MPYLKKKSKPEKNFGFTFIEMLIVTVILSVISLAIYNTLNNGLKIWKRANQQFPHQDIYILFDKFSVDLSNAFSYQSIIFSGAEGSLEFATLVNSQELAKKTAGRVSYFYSNTLETLTRQQQDITQVYSNKDDPSPEIIKGIKSLRFQYFFFDTGTKRYIWDNSYSFPKLPLAVKLELELEEGDVLQRFTRTVNIPSGG
ncbi:MAG: prepilin-type N-terminal cleavage/methylation domain-containing protein [Candidatus Omnitrophica bacterium]|nr:prepilin-type N-terminal cleavage/methylation domain-containing protein [Candidatus Omnitrophota bacterium]